jgi:hypothetical protein
MRIGGRETLTSIVSGSSLINPHHHHAAVAWLSTAPRPA